MYFIQAIHVTSRGLTTAAENVLAPFLLQWTEINLTEDDGSVIFVNRNK